MLTIMDEWLGFTLTDTLLPIQKLGEWTWLQTLFILKARAHNPCYLVTIYPAVDSHLPRCRVGQPNTRKEDNSATVHQFLGLISMDVRLCSC